MNASEASRLNVRLSSFAAASTSVIWLIAEYGLRAAWNAEYEILPGHLRKLRLQRILGALGRQWRDSHLMQNVQG